VVGRDDWADLAWVHNITFRHASYPDVLVHVGHEKWRHVLFQHHVAVARWLARRWHVTKARLLPWQRWRLLRMAVPSLTQLPPPYVQQQQLVVVG